MLVRLLLLVLLLVDGEYLLAVEVRIEKIVHRLQLACGGLYQVSIFLAIFIDVVVADALDRVRIKLTPLRLIRILNCTLNISWNACDPLPRRLVNRILRYGI